ncbi:hypothetical protein BT96DRAFT_992003 [Gymnopus androsaceus JB14]|uniref:DNA breaking-rejoining enzyme n=1 Tax=Gymnopus androsaceus JB14 TaxID=1447944 RepID=A0A6A4HU24_9AGAR|nr:hypothetical protein BT96DRAFT_992003 [Gymnopus androsaceus JB14]
MSQVLTQLRGGKILPTSTDPNEYDISSFPTVKDLKPPNENGDRKLKLPKTKVSQSKGKEVIYSPQPGRTSPTRAFHQHIHVNKLGPNNPLLAYRDHNNELKVLTKSIFLKQCNTVWVKHDIPRMTGHCFRIGGTTHYLTTVGIPPRCCESAGQMEVRRLPQVLERLGISHFHPSPPSSHSATSIHSPHTSNNLQSHISHLYPPSERILHIMNFLFFPNTLPIPTITPIWM